MKERKYKKEYRVVTRIDPRTGRERRSTEYVGALYRFPEGSPAPRRRAIRLSVPLALYWLATLAYLKTAGATGRCMYALVPFLPGLFPGVYGAMGLVCMLRAPERMTVVQRENGVGRLMRCGLGCGAFSTLGTVGAVVFLCVSGQWTASWHEPLLMALAAAAGWMLFARSRADYHALEAIPGDASRKAEGREP